MQKQYPKQLGRLGEKIALQYLQNLGYRFLASNFHLRGGELDLIMWLKGIVVFFEIKTRRSLTGELSFGQAEEQISWQQKHTLIRSARSFLHIHNLAASPWQFDLISINLKLSVDPPQAKLKHLQDIFAR